MQSTAIALHLDEEDITRYAARTEIAEGQTRIGAIIENCTSNSFDVVCLPLTNKEWHTRWREMCIDTSGTQDGQKERRAELWRSGGSSLRENEVILSRLEESINAFALASDWIYLDAPDEWVRIDSELALQQEVAWASYLNIGVIILPPPQHRETVASYARAVNAVLNGLSNSRLEVSIRIPVYNPRSHSSTAPDASASNDSLILSWEMWDLIRTICDYSPKLSVSEYRSFDH